MQGSPWFEIGMPSGVRVSSMKVVKTVVGKAFPWEKLRLPSFVNKTLAVSFLFPSLCFLKDSKCPLVGESHYWKPGERLIYA